MRDFTKEERDEIRKYLNDNTKTLPLICNGNKIFSSIDEFIKG
jgi:hypothetical protein